ncbi:hypothetical protein NIM86_15775 [Notoacmeibacter sp. MSK16QG-6]|nr:hypothetical protein [Notoacmeibacter sp. MSK16QG-6]MCP1200873.1 hypothetical protein [Notoacmeibacter sp. MSK16QG-6]
MARMSAFRRIVPVEHLVVMCGMQGPDISIVAAAPNILIDAKFLLSFSIDTHSKALEKPPFHARPPGCLTLRIGVCLKGERCVALVPFRERRCPRLSDIRQIVTRQRRRELAANSSQ